MIENSWSCPECGGFAICEIIWGYPSPTEMTMVKFGKAVLGGPNPYRYAPTLLCQTCGFAWSDESELPAAQPVPSTCHYCDEKLTAADKLRFEMAVAEFQETVSSIGAEQQANTFITFESGLFAIYPLPVCGRCRDDIHTHQLDRKEDSEQAARLSHTTRRIALWLVIAGLLAYVLVVWFTES